MNPDSHQLLDDLFEETAPADFQQEVLGQMLRKVRQRRRVRVVSRGVLAVSLLAALSILFGRKAPPSRVSDTLQAKTVAQPGYNLVVSQPFNPAQIVATIPNTSQLATSAQHDVAIVATEAGKYRSLTDDQLLGLFAGHSAALVRYSPHQVELVFVNPDEAITSSDGR